MIIPPVCYYNIILGMRELNLLTVGYNAGFFYMRFRLPFGQILLEAMRRLDRLDKTVYI
jgi:hypothetical protein